MTEVDLDLEAAAVEPAFLTADTAAGTGDGFATLPEAVAAAPAPSTGILGFGLGPGFPRGFGGGLGFGAACKIIITGKYKKET